MNSEKNVDNQFQFKKLELKPIDLKLNPKNLELNTPDLKLDIPDIRLEPTLSHDTLIGLIEDLQVIGIDDKSPEKVLQELKCLRTSKN